MFLGQGMRKSRLEGAVATAFYTVVPIVCVSSVWVLFHVTFWCPEFLYGFTFMTNLCIPVVGYM
jgi:hypothetical protein